MHVLFAFGPITSFRLQKILADHLQRIGWRVSFLQWDNDAAVIERARAEFPGVEVFSLDRFPSSDRAQTFSIRTRAAALIAKRYKVESFDALRKALAQELGRSHAALGALDPTAIVVSEDGVSSNFRLLSAARSRGIPIIDVPYGYFARKEFDKDLARKKASGDLHVVADELRLPFRLVLRQWLKKGQHEGALMLPASYILAAESLGVTLPDPWTVHGGVADALCVENNAAREHYTREGIPQRKMRMTGSPYADVVYQSLSADPTVQAARRLPRWITDRPRVLVSWVPDYHVWPDHKSEFPTYDEMTSAFFDGIAALNADVTISLHPACPDRVEPMLRSKGLTIGREDVLHLIPRHDVFTTYYSSTVRWALACGKPVVNYDAYGAELSQFNAPGFHNFRNADGVLAAIKRLTSDKAEFQKAAEPQCADAERWGIIDGLACARITDLIREMTR